jgi:hypothetical protein
MPEINYSIDCKLSNFEWFLIREVRRLQQYGYGDVAMKCVDGTFVDMRIAQTQSREVLENLQPESKHLKG